MDVATVTRLHTGTEKKNEREKREMSEEEKGREELEREMVCIIANSIIPYGSYHLETRGRWVEGS